MTIGKSGHICQHYGCNGQLCRPCLVAFFCLTGGDASIFPMNLKVPGILFGEDDTDDKECSCKKRGTDFGYVAAEEKRFRLDHCPSLFPSSGLFEDFCMHSVQANIRQFMLLDITFIFCNCAVCFSLYFIVKTQNVSFRFSQHFMCCF